MIGLVTVVVAYAWILVVFQLLKKANISYHTTKKQRKETLSQSFAAFEHGHLVQWINRMAIIAKKNRMLIS
jgi:uncharacterized protein YybS (DUF2232 family)